MTFLLAVETLVAASLGALATEVAFLSALVALGGGSAGAASALKSKQNDTFKTSKTLNIT